METLISERIAPRIYVACLAAYNNGILHGKWINADQGEDEIWEGIRAMLAASPIAGAEEYAIHDYEGFEGVRIEEYTGVAELAEIAVFLAEHGPLGGAVIAHFSGDLDEARQALSNQYLGCHPSLADYVQDTTEDAITIPEALRFYIDWQAMAHDAELSGELFTIETGYREVHVFAGY